MGKPDLIMTLGTKAAMDKNIKVKASIDIDVHVTRRYIWVMKLRTIWAVIRARMNE